mgnify:CR=1 FL=1
MLLETYLLQKESINLKISKVNVGWHIDHSLKVINAVISTMQKSNPDEYEDNFKFLGKLLFALQIFPRGKAKAPKHVKPPEIILNEDLIHQLALAKKQLQQIELLDKNAFFKHPLFGNVNKQRVLTFLNIHTKHHLKIIKHILV